MSNAFTWWLASKIFDSKPIRNRIYDRDPDFIVGPRNDPYLLRWWLIPRNRLFNVYLHVFLKSDDDRALHDHPWWSASLALVGSMQESYRVGRREGERLIQRGDVTWRSARFAHILSLPPGQHAVTLFVTGPVIREWGFHCPKGWVPWRQFTAPSDKGQTGRGCE